MTSEARQREAEQVATAYQVALSRLGVKTTAEAIALWDHVPPASKPSIVQSWLEAAVHLILGRRVQSVALARAYYRLTRALQTGKTVADPFHPDPENVTLGDLRRQFANLAGPGAPQSDAADSGSPQVAPAKNAAPAPAGPRETDASSDDDEDRILVEEIERLKELELANEAAAEEEIRTALEALGPVNQARLVEEVSKQEHSIEERNSALADAHSKAGARQAAAAARIAMNGARSTTWTLQENDKRAIGYVRISTTGTPCGWCAMLISRGPVYRSARSASTSYDDGDKYHDNCYCIAVPVFSKDWYDGSPIFDLNRTYSDLWPKVTAGLGSGKEALSAWRRFIRTEQAATKRSPGGSRSPSNVQEA